MTFRKKLLVSLKFNIIFGIISAHVAVGLCKKINLNSHLLQYKTIYEKKYNSNNQIEDSKDNFDNEIVSFSNTCQTLIQKEATVTKSQVNHSLSVSKFMNEQDIDKQIDLFSQTCKNLILSKTTPVSTDLY